MRGDEDLLRMGRCRLGEDPLDGEHVHVALQHVEHVHVALQHVESLGIDEPPMGFHVILALTISQKRLPTPLGK
jgi:hypothetical protein